MADATSQAVCPYPMRIMYQERMSHTGYGSGSAVYVSLAGVTHIRTPGWGCLSCQPLSCFSR